MEFQERWLYNLQQLGVNAIASELEETPKEVVDAAQEVLDAADNLSWVMAAAEEAGEMHATLSDVFGTEFSDEETQAVLQEMKNLQEKIEAERPAWESKLVKARIEAREALAREKAKPPAKRWASIDDALKPLREGSQDIDGSYAVDDGAVARVWLDILYGKDAEDAALTLNGYGIGQDPFKIASVLGWEIHHNVVIVELGSEDQDPRNVFHAPSWGTAEVREHPNSEWNISHSLGQMKRRCIEAFTFGGRSDSGERVMFGMKSLNHPAERRRFAQPSGYVASEASILAGIASHVQKADDTIRAVTGILGPEPNSSEAKEALEQMRAIQKKCEAARTAAALELREYYIAFRKAHPRARTEGKDAEPQPLGNARLQLHDGDQDIGGTYFMDEAMIAHALRHFLLEGFQGEVIGVDIQPGHVVVDLASKDECERAKDLKQKFWATDKSGLWLSCLQPRTPRPGLWPPAPDAPEDRAPD